MTGTDGEQIRAEPIERCQQVRPTRLGDSQDGHHRRDADGNTERRQAAPQPAGAQTGRPDPGEIE